MKRPTAIIADDEEILCIGLRNMLEKLWPELIIVGEAGDGRQTVALIQKHTPDIAFLDIQMPAMTGLEVAAKVSDRTRVVFVTAYDQFAIQAFESEAVDYVLKPVMENRLEKTVERLKKHLSICLNKRLCTYMIFGCAKIVTVCGWRVEKHNNNSL